MFTVGPCDAGCRVHSGAITCLNYDELFLCRLTLGRVGRNQLQMKHTWCVEREVSAPELYPALILCFAGIT